MQSEQTRDCDVVRPDGSRRVTGVIRRMDQLGRVVVPAELRRALGIRQGDLIETRLENGRVVMIKVEPECAVCGAAVNLIDVHGKHVCDECVRQLVEQMDERTATALR